MNYLISTKLAVELQETDNEKTTKVNFSNVIPDASEAAILALGDVMKNLAADDTQLEGVTKTQQTRYVK